MNSVFPRLPWIWNFLSISISISTDFAWISMDISMDTHIHGNPAFFSVILVAPGHYTGHEYCYLPAGDWWAVCRPEDDDDDELCQRRFQLQQQDCGLPSVPSSDAAAGVGFLVTTCSRYVVKSPSVDGFNLRNLGTFWCSQDVYYNYKAIVTGTGNRSTVMW